LLALLLQQWDEIREIGEFGLSENSRIFLLLCAFGQCVVGVVRQPNRVHNNVHSLMDTGAAGQKLTVKTEEQCVKLHRLNVCTPALVPALLAAGSSETGAAHHV
jgi:hypothetical protein